MKVVLIVLFVFALSIPLFAQRKRQYSINVIEHNSQRHRGIFYAANNYTLRIINQYKDTVEINAVDISDIYIKRRGIVGPLVAVGGGSFLFAAVVTPGIVGIALFLVGIPVGAGAGFLLALPFANKVHYNKLKAEDFPLIKTELRKYTVLK